MERFLRTTYKTTASVIGGMNNFSLFSYNMHFGEIFKLTLLSLLFCYCLYYFYFNHHHFLWEMMKVIHLLCNIKRWFEHFLTLLTINLQPLPKSQESDQHQGIHCISLNSYVRKLNSEFEKRGKSKCKKYWFGFQGI